MNILDTFLLNKQLSEEELLIQKTAETMQRIFKPRVIEANRNEIFDKSIYKELGSLGLLGPTISVMLCWCKLCFLWINCKRN